VGVECDHPALQRADLVESFSGECLVELDEFWVLEAQRLALAARARLTE